jgi:hypothetical protein
MRVRCDVKEHGWFDHAWHYFHHRIATHKDDLETAVRYVSDAVSVAICRKEKHEYDEELNPADWEANSVWAIPACEPTGFSVGGRHVLN